MAATTMWELIGNAFYDSAGANLGLFYVMLFITFLFVMARLKIPIVPAAIAGFVLLYALYSISNPFWGIIYGLLILGTMVLVGKMFLKIGRA